MQDVGTASDKSGCEYTGCRRHAKGDTPGTGGGVPPSDGGSGTGGSAEKSGKRKRTQHNNTLHNTVRAVVENRQRQNGSTYQIQGHCIHLTIEE